MMCSLLRPFVALPSDVVVVVLAINVVGVVVVCVVGVVSADAGVVHGPMSITSKSCWLYLCGLICRRIVRARSILLYTPIRDSPVDVSFPSHIPMKTRGSRDHVLYGFAELTQWSVLLFVPSVVESL